MSRPSAAQRNGKPPRPGKGESADYAYRILRQELVSLALVPGSDFDEADIVRRLGISRTPLREAVVRLASEGLVKLSPNRGARVAPLEWQDIREHLEAFEVAQRLVCRWAAIRRNEHELAELKRLCDAFREASRRSDANTMANQNWDFHAAIAHCCKNERMTRFYLQLLTENLRISHMAMGFDYYNTKAAYHAHIDQILREHDDIVDAIARRDADAADKLALSHAGLARRRVTEVLSQSTSEDIELDVSWHESRSGGGHV